MKLSALTLGALLFAAGPAAEPKAVGFDVLASFDYVEGMELPAEVTKLDGVEVVVPGFMRREDGGAGATQYFMLISDNCGCTGTPKLNEIVFCAMADGETTEIQPGSVKVTGTLWVGEEKEDGVVIGIYGLDVKSIQQ
jgi:hypothetical protein